MAIGILARAIASQKSDNDSDSYRAAFLDAARADKSAEAVIDALRTALEKDDDVNAAILLGVFGRRAKSAVPALVRLELLSPEGTTALAAIKPTAAERLPGLVAELRDEQSGLHPAAALKLAELGPVARQATRDLRAAIQRSPNRSVATGPSTTRVDTRRYDTRYAEGRLQMVQALIRIAGPTESLPVVAELLEKDWFPLMRAS